MGRGGRRGWRRRAQVELNALERDLRDLASCSNEAKAQAAALPALRACFGPAVTPEVDAAIDRLPDDAQRSALAALLHGGPDRWTNLSVRGRRAAEALGLTSYDSYRRARDDGMSPLDVSISHLAASIWLAQQRARRSRRSRAAGAAAVVLLVVGGAIGAARLGGGGDRPGGDPAGSGSSATGTSSRRCQAVVGALGRGADQGLARYVVPFRAAAGGADTRCAKGPIERWDQLVVQRLGWTTEGHGGLVADRPDHVLLLSEAELNSYHQISGRSGEAAQRVAGLPIRVERDGRASLLRTANGAVVSAGREQPGFYLGGPLWSRWHAAGGTERYGLPMSNPVFDAAQLHQDFERGRFVLPFGGSLRWEAAPAASAALPSSLTHRILRNDDGTAWFVDDRRRRHWIPDGGTYVCLARGSGPVFGSVPGSSIATLPLGAPATCSTR